MTVTANFASNAYANAMKVSQALTKDAKATDLLGTDTGQFAEMVTGALESVSKSGKKSEATAIDVAQGNGSLVDLVTTIAETEVAIETLVTTRDRVISAYRDIMNMPI